MTECLDVAHAYTQNHGVSRSNFFLSTIFVNEVLESEKLKVIKFEKLITVEDTQEELYQFHKYHHVKSPQLTEKDYKQDSIGRRYRSFPVKYRFDEFVARDSVTIPRYLIVFQPKVED